MERRLFTAVRWFFHLPLRIKLHAKAKRSGDAYVGVFGRYPSWLARWQARIERR